MKHIIISLTLGIALTLVLLVLLPAGAIPGSISNGRAASVIFVDCDAEGNNTGQDWINAYTSLQTALDNASYGDQIWVAAGVYVPSKGVTRTATFQLVEGVELYGGFEGGNNDEDMDDRDWETNLTTLSGDKKGNDSNTNGPMTNLGDVWKDNVYHVVTGNDVTETALLDGFTITAGYANDSNNEHHQRGGGMFNSNGSPTLVNITFSGNWAIAHGGGMENQESSHPTLENVTFIGNRVGDDGGGMHNDNSNPTLINVTFIGNRAEDGGGMHNYNSNPSLKDVTFSSNRADTSGGGMYNETNSQPQLTDCEFEQNVANHRGGGMYNINNSSPTLLSVIFADNSATYYGGGMANWDNSSPSLTDINFSGNKTTNADPYTSDAGGGIFNSNNSSPSLTNVTFYNNQANGYGGGMRNYNNSNPNLFNVTFKYNEATSYGGGGMSNYESHPTLTDVTFSGNYSGEDGGGVSNWESNPSLINVTFIGNEAGKDGGGMYTASNGNIIMINAILSGNKADENGGAMSFYDSIITMTNITSSGNWAGNYGGAMYTNDSDTLVINTIMWGDLDSTDYSELYYEGENHGDFIACDVEDRSYLQFDPWFIEPISATQAPTTDGNYHLRLDSLAIDFGENSLVTIATDLDGKARIADGDRKGYAIVDIGAYEAYSPIHVDRDAKGPEYTGWSWTSAYTNVQDALAAANPGDEIWVAEGIYYPDEGRKQKNNDPSSTFKLIDGVAIYGGFAGGDDNEGMNNRDWRTNLTILSGDLDGNDDSSNGIVVNTNGISGTNAYHVVSSFGMTGTTRLDDLNATTRLDGFIITAGSATGNIDNQQSGGGMYNWASSPNVANIIFSGNYASDDGGGIHNFRCDSAFVNITFNGNQAGENGGGMHNYISYPIIINTLFSKNQATNGGGGMYNDDESDVKLVNVTFSGNQATDGGAIHTNKNSQTSLTNAILWGNQSNSGGPTIYNTGESTTNINYSAIEDELPSEGEGNLRLNPRFINPGEENYRLASNSPVFDKGNNTSFTETLTAIISGTTNFTDLDDNPRFIDVNEDGNPIVDMGAYELQSLSAVSATYQLSVTLAGSALGSVSSEPPGISCPGNCSYSYPESSVITLTATSSDSVSFDGWNIASCGTTLNCSITLEADRNIIANFSPIIIEPPPKYQVYLPLVVR